jgi:rare lipoprotein A (peptidoglycan hydrolase)
LAGDARRIVDLSRRAAAELGILRAGIGEVTLRVIALPARKAAQP